MQSDHGTQLVSYNPKKKKFRKFNVYRSGSAVTRYIPSFYSLKTVMGESFQRDEVIKAVSEKEELMSGR
ncbi:hypothetical protein RND71_026691 [Anisodus tanguticus]|uniref:Uncharacterized protein n=1 Tax=Anisodus tanguticus TaxID=243964 RepID=A0AAE1RPC6_9SOLA|nr:hypothetical protein RND71_026691 [Anisodus tanguticus]